MKESSTTEEISPGDSATRRRNRSRLLDATASLMSTGEPLKRLNISRIVSAAGMSRAAFYLHFRSKEDLIRALAEREISSWIIFATPTLDRSTVSQAALRRLAVRIIEVYRAHCGVLSGIIELAEYDEETRRAWRETMHSIARRFESALRLWRPGLPEAEAALLARMIAWAGERFLHQEVRDAPSDQDELLAGTLTEMVWKLAHE